VIHSGGHEDHGDRNSILLADARGQDADERARFLDGDDNRDEADEDDEDRPRMGSRRTSRSGVMSSYAAQRSVVDIDGFGISTNDDDDASTSASRSGSASDLSAKAGIILVRSNTFSVSINANEDGYHREFITFLSLSLSSL
jgi:hypothetical protein